MVMLKIRGHWYDVSIAWPFILLMFVIAMAVLLPVLARLRTPFSG